MKKVVLYLIIFFMSICIYSENSFYKRGDLNIVLEASIQNKAIHVYLILKNNKSENCYIPYDYLNFYCEYNNEQTMKNDWLRIYDYKNRRIPYTGLVSSPIKKWEIGECYYLGKNQEYIISLNDLQNNYAINNTKWITIKYLGPLGESNTVKLKIK